jgi:hypothetical protein
MSWDLLIERSPENLAFLRVFGAFSKFVKGKPHLGHSEDCTQPTSGLKPLEVCSDVAK